MNPFVICPVCGYQIARSAKSCPHCGAKNKKPFYQKGQCNLFLLFLLILGIAAFPDAPVEPLLFLNEPQANRDGLLYAIRGSLQNASGKDYTYVQINFPLYDAQGHRQDTAICNLNGLKGGEAWQFSASALDMEQKIVSFGAEQLISW